MTELFPSKSTQDKTIQEANFDESNGIVHKRNTHEHVKLGHLFRAVHIKAD